MPPPIGVVFGWPIVTFGPPPVAADGRTVTFGRTEGVGGQTLPSAEPAQTYVGATVVGTAGAVVAAIGPAPTALAALTRPCVQNVPVPSILSTLVYSLLMISACDALGYAARMRPITPATIGEAIDVPLRYPYCADVGSVE